MDKMVFSKFYEIHPELNHLENSKEDFVNNDEALRIAIERVNKSRISLGLDGLVGDLEGIIINVEDNNLETTMNEFLTSTGYDLYQSYENETGRYIILSCRSSAHIIIKSSPDEEKLFLEYNSGPKSSHLPSTRLETFVFKCSDIKKYFDIQRNRGVGFITEHIVETENYMFIQTIPSSFTGNSIGVIQWKNSEHSYFNPGDKQLVVENKKKAVNYLNNIGKLDHSATRVRAAFRDSALIEFMELTNYDFALAIYVPTLNSITSVVRLKDAKYAAVFTSGIKQYTEGDTPGPTEMFIHNYGIRVHHLAFETEDINYTYNCLARDDYRFMSEVVGSEKVGIKQAFSQPSPNTLLVNEYISRFGGFDGFFIEENVRLLTKATENQ